MYSQNQIHSFHAPIAVNDNVTDPDAVLSSMQVNPGTFDNPYKPVDGRPIRTLTAKEEKLLIRRWEQFGDTEAKECLMRAQRPLVWKMARRYSQGSSGTLDLNDFVQAGYEACLEALAAFQPGKGFRLTTLCSTYIKNTFLQLNMHNRTATRLGTNSTDRRILSKGVKACRDLERKNQAALDRDDYRTLARDFNVEEERFTTLVHRIRHGDDSIYMKTSGEHDGNDQELIDTLPGNYDDEDTLVERASMSRISTIIADALVCLDPRERDILESRLLASDEPATFLELAARHNISRERVRQLETRGLAQMREILEIEGIESEDVFCAA